MDLIQDYSMTTIVLLLQYLRRGELPQFSMDDAHNLYDKLIDNGYTLETILFDVIYEAMVVSGFLAKDDLESIKTQKEEAKKEAKKTLQRSDFAYSTGNCAGVPLLSDKLPTGSDAPSRFFRTAQRSPEQIPPKCKFPRL